MHLFIQAERFEEDKTWLFSGVAIRMATDLNLHRKSVASLPGNPHPDDPVVVEREREIINRERTWLMCFNIDRSISGQMGKPWTIREDWIIRNSRHWCLQRLSQPWDLGISGLVELLRLTSRQLDFLYSSTTSVSGLNTEIDYGSILRVFNEQIEEWHSVWTSRGFFRSPHEHQDNKPAGLRDVPAEESVGEAAPSANATEAEKEAAERYRSANTNTPPPDDEDHHRRTLHFITKQAPMRYNYAVLILNSFGLQHAVDFPTRSGLDKGLYFTKCLEAAKGIVAAARDGLRPVLRYSPDTHFVIISYACVFLLKVSLLIAHFGTLLKLTNKYSLLARHLPITSTRTKCLPSLRTRPTSSSQCPCIRRTHQRCTLPFCEHCSKLDKRGQRRAGAGLRRPMAAREVPRPWALMPTATWTICPRVGRMRLPKEVRPLLLLQGQRSQVTALPTQQELPSTSV